MICDYCQGKTKLRRVKKSHTYKGRLYIVENVAAEVCLSCGERYFHAKTLDSIDEMLNGKHKVKKTLKVEVVALN
jgi:YgiT-type zinc finger domain-containing protein